MVGSSPTAATTTTGSYSDRHAKTYGGETCCDHRPDAAGASAESVRCPGSTCSTVSGDVCSANSTAATTTPASQEDASRARQCGCRTIAASTASTAGEFTGTRQPSSAANGIGSSSTTETTLSSQPIAESTSVPTGASLTIGIVDASATDGVSANTNHDRFGSPEYRGGKPAIGKSTR
jgi:hypothetical protein